MKLYNIYKSKRLTEVNHEHQSLLSSWHALICWPEH